MWAGNLKLKEDYSKSQEEKLAEEE